MAMADELNAPLSADTLEKLERFKQGMESAKEALAALFAVAIDTAVPTDAAAPVDRPRMFTEGKADIKGFLTPLEDFSPEAKERLSDINKSIEKIDGAVAALALRVAAALLPALSRATEAAREWTEANQGWVSTGLEEAAKGVAHGFERFGNVLSDLPGRLDGLSGSLASFLQDFSMMEQTSDLVAGALTGLLLVFAPLVAGALLIGTAITAASLLFAEFFKVLEGGDSAIDGWVRGIRNFCAENEALLKGILYAAACFAGFKAALALEGGALDLAKAGIAALVTLLGQLNAAVKANAFPLLASEAVAAARVIHENWGGIAGFFAGLWGDIETAAGKAGQKLREVWDSAAAQIKELFTTLWGEIREAFPDFAKWAEDACASIVQAFREAGAAIQRVLANILPDWAKKLFGKLGLDFSGEGGAPEMSEKEALQKARESLQTVNTAAERMGVKREGADAAAPVRPTVPVHEVYQGRGMGGMQQTNTYNVNQHISTSDALQAGQAAIAMLKGQALATPGSQAVAG